MTKRLILDRALELFTDKGYEGCSMDDIAKAVGIRKASLYAHFDGKERVFATIFEEILDEYVRYIDELTAPEPDDGAVARLKRIFLSFIRYCHGNLRMYFWDRYFYYPPEFLKEYIGLKTRETNDIFLERIGLWIEKGVGSGEICAENARSLALAYYYLMIGLSMSVKLFDEAELRREAEAAWNGLNLD